MIIALRENWVALSPNARGALWALLATIFMSGMAVIAKYLGNELNSFEVAFFRAFFGWIVILPFVWRAGAASLKTKRIKLHAMRGTFGAMAMMSGFFALTHLPLAMATSLSFARPLFMIVLAIAFLGEVVRARRWTATVVGLIGVLIVVRPTGAIELATLFSIFSAFMVASAMVVTKLMAPTERPSTVIFYAGIFASLLTLIPAIVVWETPTLSQFGLLIAMGAIGTLGSNCMIRAISAGEATVVAPVEYVRIIFAAVLGFLIFSEVPDIFVGIGAVVIVGSTLYITLREARLGKPKPQPATD